MERHSELESFLVAQQTEGAIDSSGAFTISREKALAKLGAFRLPFAEAWILKLIQAAVAAQTSAIRVDLTSRETVVLFSCSLWTLDAVETAFYDPEDGSSESLNELCAGLWGVGLGQKRPFQVSLPGEADTLVWNGRSLMRMPSAQRRDCVLIAVGHQSTEGEGANWIAAQSRGGKENAGLLQALSNHAYPCPVPLTVDGRRLDGLPLRSRISRRSKSMPLAVRFLDAAVPSLPIPESTFGPEVADWKTRAKGALDIGPAQLLHGTEPVKACAAVGVFLSHLKLESSGIGRGSRESWRMGKDMSQLCWVRHGVVVEVERLSFLGSFCTVELHASAEGLSADLSTLQLVSSLEKRERKRILFAALCENITRHRALGVSSVAAFDYRALPLLALGGLGGVLVDPSLALMGVLAFLGYSKVFMSGKKEMAEIELSYRDMTKQLAKPYLGPLE